ncbi:hypothetical protein AN8388.2 [Aspergillus nidulans FGSC A4]|nr:hypothetical protein AN8388.2 [Aspergillus nidulans FGSC A4]|eukprot:XP_681657.1 hypothetical protein AN8388.2 [Aspergillus nidulans FGSC A4]
MIAPREEPSRLEEAGTLRKMSLRVEQPLAPAERVHFHSGAVSMLLSIVRALPPGIYWIRCIQEGLPVGPGDDYLFHAGEIHGHNVVIAAFAAGQPYGTNSATSLASHVKKFFPNLWFGLLVGVSTGLPNFSCSPPRDIRLSNVIVAWSPPGGDYPAIIPYGLGKQKGDVGLSCCAMDIPCLRQDALWAPQLTRRESFQIGGKKMTCFTSLARIYQFYDNTGRTQNARPYAAVMAAAFAKAVLVEVPSKSTASVNIKPLIQKLSYDTLRPQRAVYWIARFDGSWKMLSFRNGIAAPQSQLLWIKGDAGKGKTMLMIGIMSLYGKFSQSHCNR